MTKKEALALIDTIVSSSASKEEKMVAESRLRELIKLLLSDDQSSNISGRYYFGGSIPEGIKFKRRQIYHHYSSYTPPFHAMLICPLQPGTSGLFLFSSKLSQMETYNHHAFGALLAASLKQISHTQERPRHFTAFGLEDLYNFTDKLSSITGMILISSYH